MGCLNPAPACCVCTALMHVSVGDLPDTNYYLSEYAFRDALQEMVALHIAF